MAEQTLEQKTAQAVLQQPIEVEIREKKYKIAPPSIATLILVSEGISTLPRVTLDNGKIVEESLAIARECRVLGDIVATLILGAKKASKHGIINRLFNRKRQRLAKTLLEELSPSELHALTAELLKTMQIGDFFGLTTFLLEVNLLRPTKVVSETTAFGQ